MACAVYSVRLQTHRCSCLHTPLWWQPAIAAAELLTSDRAAKEGRYVWRSGVLEGLVRVVTKVTLMCEAQTLSGQGKRQQR